jgi:hypothetical protein
MAMARTPAPAACAVTSCAAAFDWLDPVADEVLLLDTVLLELELELVATVAVTTEAVVEVDVLS